MNSKKMWLVLVVCSLGLGVGCKKNDGGGGGSSSGGISVNQGTYNGSTTSGSPYPITFAVTGQKLAYFYYACDYDLTELTINSSGEFSHSISGASYSGRINGSRASGEITDSACFGPTPVKWSATLADPIPKGLAEVYIFGTGSGRVVSSPSGIDCTENCYALMPLNTPITFTAFPDSGSSFHWDYPDACQGSTTTCTITIKNGEYVVGTFN